MDTQKQSIIDRIRQANNVLVTVSANPTVDQLAACVGLTIMLNDLDKRATAVFSGEVPSTLEFLQPENTIEKNTDSLQDFIIALDKSKADKLRYKVEDQVVKIFITPYRTSLSPDDLEFSKGEFNVEVVVCLGVQDQKDLDQAITSHGRILHDATVISVNTQGNSTIGTLNWQDPQASSLSEMVASLAEGFGAKLDAQIATALLTGVVAETDRFSNSKTSPQTMQVSALLMAAGANQQLVATKLQTPASPTAARAEAPEESKEDNNEPPATTSGDGTLSIAHDASELPTQKSSQEKPKTTKPEGEEQKDKEEPVNLPPVQPTTEETPPPPTEASEKEEGLPASIHIDEQAADRHIKTEDRPVLEDKGPTGVGGQTPPAQDEQPAGAPSGTPSFVLTPPALGGVLTANSQPEGLDPSTDPFSNAQGATPPILTHNASAEADNSGINAPTLNEENARSAVADARNSGPTTGLPTPRTDLSAKPLTGDLHDNANRVEEPVTPTESLGKLVEPLAAGANEPAPAADSPSAKPMDMPLPTVPLGPLAPPIEPLSPAPTTNAPTAPMGPAPTAPPPFMPQQPIMPNTQ